MKRMRRYLPLTLLFLTTVASAKGREPLPLQKPYVVESASSFSFRSVEDDHGGFYLVWPHVEGERTVLRAQHVSDKGTAMWAEPGLAVTPRIAPGTFWDASADSGGGLLLSWEEDEHIATQRVSPEGKPLWPAHDETVSVSTSSQKYPALTADGSGGAFVVWQEKRLPNRWVLYAQHINALGARLWTPEGSRVSLRPSDQRRPKVVYDGSAGIIVAWKDFRENASQLQVQRLNYQGNRLWGLEGLLVTAPAGDPVRPPYLAGVGGGSAVLAWQASSSGTDRVFLQLVDASGKLNWGAQGVELTPGTWHEWNPVVHGDGQGGTWVGWEDYRNNANWRIFIRHLHVTGESGWPAGESTLTNVPADQGHLGITDDGRGGILAAWVDNRYGTVGVYLQEISERGEALLGAEGMTLATRLVSPETRPQVVSLGPGKVAVSWTDTPSKGTWALYWQALGPLQPITK